MKYHIEISELRTLYVEDLLPVESIADKYGCSVANIKRLLKLNNIVRGRIYQKSKKPWNAGMTKETDQRLRAMSESHKGKGNPMHGRDSWNKGLTKESSEVVAQFAAARIGIKFSETTKLKLSEAKKGKFGALSNNWQGGRSYVNHLGYQQCRYTYMGKRWYMHRLIATLSLGRDLLEVEEVHHVDRQRRNNVPENLLVMLEEDHNRLHRAIEAFGLSEKYQQVEWLKQNKINFEDCEIGKNNIPSELYPYVRMVGFGSVG